MLTSVQLRDKQKTISKALTTNTFSDELLIAKEDQLEAYYSPFDYINENAKLIIVGISPGETQAKNANQAYAELCHKGMSEEMALKRAKEVASFSGAMRKNIIELLDYIGMDKLMNLLSCSALFTKEANHLVHYTSVFRYPVLKNGKPISTAKGYRKSKLLSNMVDTMLEKELHQLKGAVIIPLGQGVNELVLELAAKESINKSCILSALPHPSGANAERIKYFLGQKPKEALSSRTNASLLDKAKEELLGQIELLKA